MRMRRHIPALVVIGFVLLIAACKRGMPPECEQYLARYDCWLGKSGVADHATTTEAMRNTWTEASKTGPGRSAVLQACNKSQAEMEARFATSGCTSATTEK
jgi:hypothetical protein